MSGGGGPKAGAPGGEVLYYVTLVHAIRFMCQHVVNVYVFFFVFFYFTGSVTFQFFYLNKDLLILQVHISRFKELSMFFSGGKEPKSEQHIEFLLFLEHKNNLNVKIWNASIKYQLLSALTNRY